MLCIGKRNITEYVKKVIHNLTMAIAITGNFKDG